MKLSVIVPVYNVEKYLRECLDSLAAQTLRDYELILVNDGSTDGSQALIDEYTARFPRLITAMTVTNGGQGRARNFGIERARGEYLGFVDSDDSVAPDILRSTMTSTVSITSLSWRSNTSLRAPPSRVAR